MIFFFLISTNNDWNTAEIKLNPYGCEIFKVTKWFTPLINNNKNEILHHLFFANSFDLFRNTFHSEINSKIILLHHKIRKKITFFFLITDQCVQSVKTNQGKFKI